MNGAASPDAVAAFLRAHPGWLRDHPELSGVLEGRAAAGLACRVQEAVLALIASPDPAEFVRAELPALLAVDAAALCADLGADIGAGGATRGLPPGTTVRLLGGRDVVFRDAPADAALLHGAAAPLARADALVRVGACRMLALASRERCRLPPGGGAGPLAFLGRAVEAALDRAEPP